MRNGVDTGSISHRDTRLGLSPALDSSQPTSRFLHLEPGQRLPSKSPFPVTVPIYLRKVDSSVSKTIRKRIPTDT